MRTLSVIFVLILSTTIVALAQPVRGTLSPARKLKLAEQIYARGDAYNALSWFESVYEDDPGNTAVLHRIAAIQYELRDYEAAESWYNRLVRRDKDRAYPYARFIHAKLLKINGNYEDATEQFNRFSQKTEDPVYKELAENELAGMEMTAGMAANDKITVFNAGDGINSPSTEQAAFQHGGRLYYSSLRSDSIIVIEDAKQDNIYAKLYAADRVQGGTWATGNVVEGINKVGYHTTSASLTEDGNTIYFTRCTIEGKQRCNIYRANGSDGNFGDAKQIKLGDNKYSFKHPSVGVLGGKEVLFFTSNMSGGYGNWDIYYIEIQGDSYGKPINAGSRVNTVGSEQTPFFQNDALFFSTNGLPTMGGYDVYESAWIDEAWSTPKHMGSEVNSRVDDMFFSLAEDGYHGYVVSNRPGTISLKSETCCDDIYTLTFLDRIPYDATATVVDQKTGLPVKGATVELYEVSPDNRLINVIQDDVSEYDFTLRGDRQYRFITVREGYLADTSEVFDTYNLVEATKIKKKITLDPIPPVIVQAAPPPAQEPIIIYRDAPPPAVITREEAIIKYGFVLPKLDTIYFDYDRHRIRSSERPVLDNVVAKLKEFPQLVVEVASHTDSRGEDSYNYRLSERRTDAAIKYLKKKGVNEAQLIPRYYGEDAPVAPNTTIDGEDNPEGRRKNRRTEFRIIEGVNSQGQIRIVVPPSQPTSTIISPAPTTSSIISSAPTTTTTPILNVSVEPQPFVETTTIVQTPPPPPPAPKVIVAPKAPELTAGGQPITKLTFEKNFHDFGTIKTGEKTSHTFKFTNTGDSYLLIEFASGSCGCTVPEWPEKPIPPGESGEIVVNFDSKDKFGEQNQEVNIIANTDPIVTELKIKVVIEE